MITSILFCFQINEIIDLSNGDMRYAMLLLQMYGNNNNYSNKNYNNNNSNNNNSNSNDSEKNVSKMHAKDESIQLFRGIGRILYNNRIDNNNHHNNIDKDTGKERKRKRNVIEEGDDDDDLFMSFLFDENTSMKRNLPENNDGNIGINNGSNNDEWMAMKYRRQPLKSSSNVENVLATAQMV